MYQWVLSWKMVAGESLSKRNSWIFIWHVKHRYWGGWVIREVGVEWGNSGNRELSDIQCSDLGYFIWLPLIWDFTHVMLIFPLILYWTYYWALKRRMWHLMCQELVDGDPLKFTCLSFFGCCIVLKHDCGPCDHSRSFSPACGELGHRFR